MKLLLTRVTLTRLLLIITACGAFAVIWIVATSDAPPADSVHIEGAGTISGHPSQGAANKPAASINNAKPTATTLTVGVRGGQGISPAAGSATSATAMAPLTPRAFVGA